jgi:hypothetical protein
VTHKIDPDVDEARMALLEGLIISRQLSKGGWLKGAGKATGAKPGFNLTGDSYFTDGYRLVMVFDSRPRSFPELETFNWEQPVSTHIGRLDADRVRDFDED